MLAFVLFVCATASAQGPSNLPPAPGPAPGPTTPKAPPRVPATAAVLSITDLSSVPELFQPLCRYIWLRDSSKETYAATTLFINSVINRSSIAVKPPLVAGGALVRVEFWRMGDTIEQVKEQVKLWDSLSEKDPQFHLSQVQTDGKSKDKKTIVESAPHLGVPMPVGLCYRYDWLIHQGGTTADGGSYYDFRGLIPGKTKLNDYLTDRGVPLDRIRKKNALNRMVTISKVTGKVRAIELYESSDVPPSESPAIAAVTQDIFDDQTDPNFDAFLSLRGAKFQGQEVLVKLRNGCIEATLWNGEGILVTEAPPNLVMDYMIPDGHGKRLQPFISCVRCHGPNEMMQPATNQVKQLLDGRLRVLGDTSADRFSQFDAIRQIQFLYGARQSQLDKVFQDTRDSFDAFTITTGSLTAKEACQAMTKAYNDYEYGYIDAALACDELGIDPKDNPIETLARILPAPDQNNVLATDARIGLLLTSASDDPKLAKQSLKITRRQWETLYPALQSLVMPTLETLISRPGKNGEPPKEAPKLEIKSETPVPALDRNPAKMELTPSPIETSAQTYVPDFDTEKPSEKVAETASVEPKWKYKTGASGRENGPFIYAELQEFARSGKLKPSDLVWNDRHKIGDWGSAGKVKGLFPDEVNK